MSRFNVGDKVIINKFGDLKGKKAVIIEVWEKQKDTLEQRYVCKYEDEDFKYGHLFDERDLDRRYENE